VNVKMKNMILSLLVAAIALPGLAQTSAPTRVAVINVQRVLLESNQGMAAREKLERVAVQKQERAQAMRTELENLEKEISTKRLSLTPEKLEEMTKSYDEKKIALQRFAQDADRELKAEEQKTLMDLERSIRPVIDQLGKEMGFALIFNKLEAGLVYASDAVEITDTVIKRYNDASAGGGSR
jgi:outer membrane protein